MAEQIYRKKQYSLKEKVTHYKKIVKRYDKTPNKYKNKQYMYAKGFISAINNPAPRFEYEFMGRDFVNGYSSYERSVWKEARKLDFERDMQMIHDDIYGK